MNIKCRKDLGVYVDMWYEQDKACMAQNYGHDRLIHSFNASDVLKLVL